MTEFKYTCCDFCNEQGVITRDGRGYSLHPQKVVIEEDFGWLWDSKQKKIMCINCQDERDEDKP